MRAKGAKVGVAHEDSSLSEGGTDRYCKYPVLAYLPKIPVNFGQLLWRNAKGLEAWMSMGSLSYGLERAPSRLVFGKAL